MFASLVTIKQRGYTKLITYFNSLCTQALFYETTRTYHELLQLQLYE